MTFKQGDRVRVTGYHLDTPATVLRTANECGGPFYIAHLDTHAEVFRTLVHASQVHALARCPECMGQNGAHGFVHVRHGNGGGHNRPCSRAAQATEAVPA